VEEALNEIALRRQKRPVELPEDIAETEGTILLESTRTAYGLGEKSFVCTDPVASVAGADGQVTISTNGKQLTRPCRTPADVIAIIQEIESTRGCPLFAAGYFGYEFACAALTGERPRTLRQEAPDFLFYLYEGVVCLDNNAGKMSVTGQITPALSKLLDLLEPEVPEIPRQEGSKAAFRSGKSRADYRRAVRKLLQHIREGDIYQANYTLRFEGRSNLSGWNCYRRLRGLNRSPYGAYIKRDRFSIISSSPERLICRNGTYLDSRPIKGTRPRGATEKADGDLKSELLHSVKDRAELLMITDLVRNDLGRVAEPGSVTVRELFALESYSAVHHLVSYIEAKLAAGFGTGELLDALLPAGSITGAPKRRAVEILRESELSSRDVYTGAIGYIYKDTCDFNVAIRTLLQVDGRYFAYAGGGIVADSDPDAEYAELMVKAENLFRSVSDRYEVLDG
jgi:anthranilate/para-aminobenzoate synthase component I